MFIVVSLEGMTGGPALSAAEGERSVPIWGKEGNGPWAVFGTQAKVLPAGLFPFSNSFLFSFLFLFEAFANKTLFHSNQFCNL
jgi:hypothetical protein